MTNLEKIRAMSAEEFVKNVLQRPACSFCVYNGKTCDMGKDCIRGRIDWLNKEDNPMPELKAGDLLFTGKIVEFYVAITPDKLVKANCFVVMDLDNVLKHDKIAYVARWNSDVNDIERIWRADDD